MSDQLNTHTYDTLLKGYIIPKIESNLKSDKFENFKNQIPLLNLSNKKIIPTAIQAIELIIDSNKNYDEKNDIHADDLLYWILNRIDQSDNKKDLYTVLIEQLSDIITRGSCSQGRTSRLLQVAIVLGLRKT